MPASQLKRLKASLREQGVTGPQKSKKQKKQQAAGKTASDRVQRNAALQQIRDSFNPFELKAVSSRPEKFQSVSHKSAQNGSGRYREVLHRPGVTKSAGEELRRNTLLPELRKRNKVGGVVDRRIGEGDAGITPEERAVQRFAREKERKSKGRGLFDLEGSDEEDIGGGFGLTHGGRKLDDLEVDDFGEVGEQSNTEDDDETFLKRKRRRDSGSQDDDGTRDSEDNVNDGPERKKSKKEVMQEVISKSKLYKYERQKAKEDDDDLRMELDQGFGEILGMLQGVRKPQSVKPPETSTTKNSGPVMNPERQKLLSGQDRSKSDKDYDDRLKQLATDARAKPSERSKTAEEKASEEAERARTLEDKRLERMRGGNVSDDDQDNGADPAVDHDDHTPDQAALFGLTNPHVRADRRSEPLVLDDEDEFALDDDLVASDEEIEDVELSEDEPSEGDEGENDVEPAPPEEEEDEFVKGVLGENVITATGANALSVNNSSATNASGHMYPCPRSHSELLDVVKDASVQELPAIIQRIRAFYHPSLSSANKESLADFSRALVDHLVYMGNEGQPMVTIEQIIRHLHSLSRTYPNHIGQQFREHLMAFYKRGQPTAGELVILTAIGSIYPTSDHWHQVVTAAITIMARWLDLNIPSLNSAAETRVLVDGALMVRLCIKYQTLSKRYIPEALRFTLRVLSGGVLDKTSPAPHLANLIAMADLWSDKSAFIESFSSVLQALQRHSAKKEYQHLTIQLRQSRFSRRPLELHHHRKLPLRTSVPKFEENFNPDKHYDPDKERSDAKKLQKEFKREKKGALRELRKDANFIAREQLREKKERDAEHEKRERRLIAEINAEGGRETNEYSREVAKRRRAKQK